MDQLRRVLSNIQEQTGRMTSSQKLLLLSLSVIAVMTMFLVSQYAAKPSMVELMADNGEMQTIDVLTRAGINASVENGKIMVPQGQQRAAAARLMESGNLPGDTTLLFNNLFQAQDWKASKDQHRQQAVIAKQNELARIISKMRGVSKATVILDIPESSGLGRAVREPSASVMVLTAGNIPMTQNSVDAIANLVAGSAAGMDLMNVKIVEGSTGRHRSVSTDEARMASQFMDQAKQAELHTKRKLESMFAHIPGVVVSVTAMVDVTKVSTTERANAKTNEGTVSVPTSISETSDVNSQVSSGAEPGVRSNQTASINQGNGSGTSSERTTSDSDFAVSIGYKETHVLDNRGMPTHIKATVIVPQEYIEDIIRRAKIASGASDEEETVGPNDAEQEFADKYKQMITELVQPHLMGVSPDGTPLTGEAVVSMAPMGASYMGAGVAMQQAGLMTTLTGGEGMLASGNLIETALVGLLALVAVVMMFMMVRRSSKSVELPSAEELVGIPPQLDTLGDLVGEAGEGENAMAGIELDDSVMQLQQLREQVAELIGADPQAAAQLVGRWAEVEE
jgi:flagellar biosynthesis/type III secretory pathway M-ring protein FliF/YscJ